MLKKTYSVLILALICVLSLCVFALSACNQSANGSSGTSGGSSSIDGGSSGSGGSSSGSSDSSDSSSSGNSGVLCADGVHDFGDFIRQIEPNCYRAGAEYRVCSRCNYREYRDVEKTNEHSKVAIPAVAPTCSSNGLTAGERCEVCGEVFVLQQSVERLPHTEEVIPAVEATCTTFGHTEGKKCSVCDEIIEEPEYIDDGHKYSQFATSEKRCTECDRLKPLDGLVFELDEETDTYTVIRCEDYYGITFFSIPMFHKGKVVAKIGEGVFRGKKIINLEIPETIVEIGKEAFAYTERTASVKIFGKTKIGDNAFERSEVLKIEMPNVTYIGKQAFTGSLIEEIKGITASVIDEMAFENCAQLKFVEFCEGVTEIKDNVFAYTTVKSIVIPSSVTYISGAGFDEYYNGQCVVYYKGTAQELEEKPQVKGGLWCISAIYYYSETEPEVNENGEYNGNFWRYDANNSVAVWKK